MQVCDDATLLRKQLHTLVHFCTDKMLRNRRPHGTSNTITDLLVPIQGFVEHVL